MGAGSRRIGAAAGLAAAVWLAPGAALAAKLSVYACESGRRITVIYPSSGETGARLTFDGRSFDLYPVRSGSGARYATEQGLAPDHGLQWWVKGEEATLSEMVMDHTAPGPTVIDTCRVDTANPPEPAKR